MTFFCYNNILENSFQTLLAQMECHKRFHSVELESIGQAIDKFQYFPRHDATLVWTEEGLHVYWNIFVLWLLSYIS